MQETTFPFLSADMLGRRSRKLSSMTDSLLEIVTGILLLVTLTAGLIISIAEGSIDVFYLRGIGVILSSGLTAVTLAVIRSSKR